MAEALGASNMTKILSSTLKRLQNLKRTNAIWEGDRRALPKAPAERSSSNNLIHMGSYLAEAAHVQPHCILWVDGSLGVVRAMEVVKAESGAEAIVRNLLLAMERPQGSVFPCLPHKILVSDRSLQFYLRGVLQDLDILVEHTEHLPLIDEIFRNILEQSVNTPPPVPPSQAKALYAQATQLWQLAPWDYLWDHQVLQIRLNHWELDSIYAVIMGRLGQEHGVTFYRDSQSLIDFRQQLLLDEEEEQLEDLFLQQNCFFCLFDSTEDLSELELRYLRTNHCQLVEQQIYPALGSINPLEGGRSYLDGEEADILTASLAALNHFLIKFKQQLPQLDFDSTKAQKLVATKTVSLEHTDIVVEVRPASELSHQLPSDHSLKLPLISQDLLPDSYLVKLGEINQEVLELVQFHADTVLDFRPNPKHPIATVIIQTSRPKAMTMIEQIEALGGIEGIGFCAATLEPNTEICVLLMGDGNYQVVNDFTKSSLKKWRKTAEQQDHSCVFLISMGATGSSRGKFVPEYILGCYHLQLLKSVEPGLSLISLP
ncbi:MAG: hypothetical protein SFT94_08415 [Pseudanabaenaceae cyanobacterium bins.68]|nr:hypothetical protein [Pseudanabaenaceae cyanobacterium bins.68]